MSDISDEELIEAAKARWNDGHLVKWDALTTAGRSDECKNMRAAIEALQALGWRKIEAEQMRAGPRPRLEIDTDVLPGDLCEDCPPAGYPTDKTRCLECPRRTTSKPEGKV